MVKNFYDEWDKLDKTTQEAVKKKTQEKIAWGYDQNKIQSHIQSNFSTTPNNTVEKTNNMNTVLNNTNDTISKNKITPYWNINNTKTTNLQTPSYTINNNINTWINSDKTNNRNQEQKTKEQWIAKSWKAFDMSNTNINQRDYMDMIRKKRQTEWFPNNAPRTWIIWKYIMPDWRWWQVEMTEEENNNMPSELSPKEHEQIKFLTNDKVRKDNSWDFESYWDKIKNNYNVSDEVKEMTRDKFNALDDEQKLKLYKAFNQKEIEEEKSEKQKTEQQKQEQQTWDKNNSQTSANKTSHTLEELKQRKQKIEDWVKNMTKEQYNKLSDEEKKQINEAYQKLDNQISELESQKDDLQTTKKEDMQEQKDNSKSENETEQVEDSKVVDNTEELNNKLEEINEEFWVETKLENWELRIWLKNEKWEELILNLYDENWNLKDKNILNMEVSKHFSRSVVSANNTWLWKNEEYEKSSWILNKLRDFFIPTAYAPYQDNNPYKDIPNYKSFTETEDYYRKELWLNYDFMLNTDSENYDEDTSMFSQENIINVLWNKDLLHEIKLYPVWEDWKADTTKEAITMYQVWQDWDTEWGQYNNDTLTRKRNRWQCAYFTSKILKEAFPYDKYPFKNSKWYPLFESAIWAWELITQLKNKVDDNNKPLFNIWDEPTIWSIYANPSVAWTGWEWHIALVINVRKIDENNYEMTLLEQNADIEIDWVKYLPSNWKENQKNYWVVKTMPADNTMVVWQRTIKININKDTSKFINKNK